MEEYTKRKDDELIVMDQGLAFGTGTHPTTTSLFNIRNGFTVEKYLDVGTGSGV